MNMERYTKPNRFDAAPFGTIYEYEKKLWVQVNESEESGLPTCGLAEWIEWGDILAKVFQICLTRKDFVVECLNIYLDKKSLPESTLRDVLTFVKLAHVSAQQEKEKENGKDPNIDL